jgi:cytidine deaminase
LPIAALYAVVPISDFKVGALCEGSSGNLYFGANIEFLYAGLEYTIHAEQASIVNADHHHEEIKSITVSAAPCGYCRQFINELEGASTIKIVLPTVEEKPFPEYLPHAFGPKDLGVQNGIGKTGNHGLVLCKEEKTDQIVTDALAAANRSYAPYSQSYAGIALKLISGKVITGTYLESAAYNPSISPVQSAIINLNVNGFSISDIQSAVLVEMENPKNNLAESTEILLKAIGHNKINFETHHIRLKAEAGEK